jgi:hypothetical protein
MIIVLLIGVVFLLLLLLDLPPFKSKPYPDYNVNWEYGVFETSNGEYLIRERRIEKAIKTNEVLFTSGWSLLERHETLESATKSYDIKLARMNETITQIL